MVLYIRKILSESLPGQGAAKATIIYGGSVEAGNIRELAASGEVGGFLPGHASAEIATFTALVKAIS